MKKTNLNLNLKIFNDLNNRIQTGFVLILFSLVVNHLAQKDSFPFASSYSFPLLSTIISIVIGTLVLIIADYNFILYKENYFKEKITAQILIRFLLSTLVYISIVYIPIYFVANWLENGDYEFYYLLTGLSITLLMSSLGVIFIFAKDIYKLHKLEIMGGKIKVKKSGKTHLVNYADIFYFHSENKIVYIVKQDGKVINTDFTLNEVDDKLNKRIFFRANRQTIIHHQSIEHSQSIENGKLLVTLKTRVPEKDDPQIIISRYKKKAFEEWLGGIL